MQGTRYVMVALIGTVLLVSGCRQDQVAAKHHPAKIEETDQKGIMRVTLEARAAERLGIETTRVSEEQVSVGGKTVTRKVVPYGALLYDTKGEAWTFTSPSPLVFVRQQVVVEGIEGDRVILAEGPHPGTVVVTVGATLLMGAEHKYGH